MHILSITAQKPHSTGSGVYMTEMIRDFRELGHSNAVIAGLYREDRVSFPEDVSFRPVCFDTERLPFPVFGMSDEMPYRALRYRDMTPDVRMRYEAAFAEALKEELKVKRPDLIICHHLYLLTALVRRMVSDIPVFGVCHGSDLRQYAANPLAREEIRDAVCRLDRICCLHEEQAGMIAERFGADRSRIHVVGSGYNDRIFCSIPQKQAEADRSCSYSDGLRLVFAGKISEKKGIYSLFRALGRPELCDKKISLTLAGGWSSEEQKQKAESFAKELSAKCGAEVTLTGPLPQPELAALFRRNDVLVLPSFYEGLPLVLAEAMACGLQVVCTALPGIREWMDENVPDHGIRFVKPPRFSDTDSPLPEDLPFFEARLAEAILEANALPRKEKDLRRLSWGEVCRRVLA